jgi:uncharacterized protein YkwD
MILKRYVLGVFLALAIAGCGGGGGGDQIPIHGIPGTGGGDKFDELTPPVTKPPAESYVDRSVSGDSAAQRWLKNSYATLPRFTSDAGVYQNPSIRVWADQVFAGVNANRIAQGRGQLKRNKHLDAVAQAHARDMALRDFFDHLNPERMQFTERLNAVNPPRYNHLGETAARGQESPQEVSSGWLGSEKHYKISMDPVYEYAGVGVFCDINNATMPMHIIMVFAEFTADPDEHTEWLEPGA